MLFETTTLKYVTASGSPLYLSSAPFAWREFEPLNYSWELAFTKNAAGHGSKITDITRQSRSFRIQLVAKDGTWSEITAMLDLMHAYFEADILAKTPGRLYLGDQYITGYFAESVKNTVIDGRGVILDLTFVSGSAFWTTEELHTFAPLTEGPEIGFILPTALPMAIVAPSSRQLVNNHYSACNAIITMYGPVSDPQFSLGSHVYAVTGSLSDGDRIEIDQTARTVTKISASGERLNFFYARGKTYSVFEPVPAGESYITSNNDFTFEILLLKERSEPQWSDNPVDDGDTYNVWTGSLAEFTAITPVSGTIYFVGA